MSRRFSRRQVRFGGPAIFTPRSIPGLVAWYRADMLVTQSGTVSAWGDSSGSGDTNRNLSQPTGANRPTYNATDAAFANQPTLQNTSGAMWLFSGTWGSTFNQPTTILCVGVMPGTGRLYDGTSVGNRQTLLSDGVNHVAYYAGTGVVATAVACTSPFVSAAVYNGASSSLYVNSSSAAAAGGNPGVNALSILGVFALADTGGAGLINDKVAEIACYSRALSQAEIAQWFRYAGARYGGAWS